jgi:Flp pilus assembly protein TadD
MAEPAHTIDHVDTIGALAQADEPSTVQLEANGLEVGARKASLRTERRLMLVPTQDNSTQAQVDEPPTHPPPSGMVEHLKAPRMAPTVGSRLTTGLRRGTLLAALAVLAASTLAVGAYVVASTTWLSALFSPSAPATGTTGATGQSQPPAAPVHSQPPAPTDATAIELREKGISLYRAGNFSASIDLLQSSVNMDGGDAVSYYQLGLAYMASEQSDAGREHVLEDAEMAFRTAISLQPSWAAPHQLLAESLLRRGFYKEAIAPASEATRLNPAPPDAWLVLGRAYQGAGQQAEATQAFAEAARHAPAPPAKR